MTLDRLTIRDVRVRSVNAPLTRPIKTASGDVVSAPLVLIDLITDQGITGSSYVFCYTVDALAATAAAAQAMTEHVKGKAVVPFELDRMLRARYRLIGVQGLMGMAMSGFDMAAWDALAKAANLPLATLLGGSLDPIPAYASYGMVDKAEAVVVAEEAMGQGFRAIKVKIGHADVNTDLGVIRAVRGVVGDDVAVMVDYNQSLNVPEAIRRARILDQEGLAWIEEPTIAEDYQGHRAIADAAQTPIQMGENWWGVADLNKCTAAGASDLAMIDIMKIGGVTGWMRAIAIAEARGLPVSSHLFVEFSAHALAVTPTTHWLEWLDCAAAVLEVPAVIKDGDFVFADAPGAGVAWDEAAVEKYAF